MATHFRSGLAVLFLLLLTTGVVSAQEEPETEAEVVTTESSEDHIVQLQTKPEEQVFFPEAGVCPVITDYLVELCQQNPDDPSCQPIH